jgi:Protein of unknown function (DUF2911).
MKKLFLLSAMALAGLGVMAQQDKSKRPSPPAKVSETTNKGVTITIDYSQPSVKGRTIGKEIATYDKVWRTGANEPTTIEVSKDVEVEGQALPAGKYSLYTIPGAEEWTIIINKKATGWGTQYDESQDALRVKVKPGKAPQFTEKMTFNVSKSGTVSLLWGNEKVDFNVI